MEIAGSVSGSTGTGNKNLAVLPAWNKDLGSREGVVIAV